MKKRMKRRMEETREMKEEKRERMGLGPMRKEAAREGRAMEAIITFGELILLQC